VSDLNRNGARVGTWSSIAGLLLFVSACGGSGNGADARVAQDATGDMNPDVIEAGSIVADANAKQDAPVDASPDGAACTCTASSRDGNGQGGPGNGPTVDLACFCTMYAGDCESYDQVARQCPSLIGQNGLVKTTYAECHLVEFDLNWGEDQIVHVYDLDTHELRGVYHSTDTSSYTCGVTRSYSLGAGVFPTCAPSQSVSLCPGDAGAVDSGTVD